MVKNFYLIFTRFLSVRGSLVIASVALTIYFLPFITQGEDSTITIHDNLDSAFNSIVAANEGTVFSSPNTIVEVL